MANVKGLVFVVLQLREQRTNLLNKVKHVDAALSVLSKLNAQENCCGSEATPGKSTVTEGHLDCKESGAWQANDVSTGPSQDRSAQRARWAMVRQAA